MVNNMTDLTAQDAAMWSTRDHLDDPLSANCANRFGPDAFTFRRPAPAYPLLWLRVKRGTLGGWRFLKETAETLRHAV